MVSMIRKFHKPFVPVTWTMILLSIGMLALSCALLVR